jgi:hypothetical protein
MAIDTRLGGWNARVCGFVYRVMAVSAVHFEFASVQGVAERNWLLGPITDVKGYRTGSP